MIVKFMTSDTYEEDYEKLGEYQKLQHHIEINEIDEEDCESVVMVDINDGKIQIIRLHYDGNKTLIVDGVKNS